MHPDDSSPEGAPGSRLDDPSHDPAGARKGHPVDLPVEPARVHDTSTAHDAAPAEFVVRLGAVESRLAEVVDRLASESDRAAARERVIDRQHEDIERLRSVERAGLLRPVITDMYRLRNDLLRQGTTVPAQMSGPQVAALLDSFAASVEEALERCGIAVMPREVGGAFVSGRHQVTGIVEIDDVARDGTVAEVVLDGYLEVDGGKVVAPARVIVARTVAPADSAEATDTTDTTDMTGTKEQTDG